MPHSFFAGIGIFLAGLFGAHPAPSQVSSAAASAVVVEQSYQQQPSQLSASSTVATSTIVYQPVIERIIERMVPPASSGMTSSELDARLQDLTGKFSTQLARIAAVNVAVPNNFVTVPVFAQAGRIDNLANVTISNATVSGVSGLTDADIPNDITASNYLPLAGGTMTGTLNIPTINASSTIFSSFVATNATSTNFFATTASSTNLFATNGNIGVLSLGTLTLTNALTVANGGTGATTFGQGWLFSNGSTGTLAASTSPTVNYITATSTIATSTFAGGAIFATGGGNVGIGTTSPSFNLSINGSMGISGTQDINFYTPATDSAYKTINLYHFGNGDVYARTSQITANSDGATYDSTYQEGFNSPFSTSYDASKPKFYIQTEANWYNSSTGKYQAEWHMDFATTGQSTLPARPIFFQMANDLSYSYEQHKIMDFVLNDTTSGFNDFPCPPCNGYFHVSSTTLAVAGKVGFATSTPDYRELSIVGNVAITNGTAFYPNASWQFSSYDYANTKGVGIGYPSDNKGNAIQGFVSGTNGNLILNPYGGGVGIGTSSPTTALQVNGVITPNADNASSLGNSAYRWSAVYAANGTIQTSDQRLKSNITDLNYGLSDVLKLRPVSFAWTAQPQQGTKLGFIAQDVQPIFPEAVTIGDDANHTLGLTYTEFIPVIVKAIQQLAAQVGTKVSTTANAVFDTITAHNAALDYVRADNIEVGSPTKPGGITLYDKGGKPGCITLSDADSGTLTVTKGSCASTNPASDAASASDGSATPAPDTTPPTITISGDNPASIHVGDSYVDLGAGATDNVDQNLGLKYFLNGALVSNIIIDTSAAATDTIDYVATDGAGNTATSSRTVIVEGASVAQ